MSRTEVILNLQSSESLALLSWKVLEYYLLAHHDYVPPAAVVSHMSTSPTLHRLDLVQVKRSIGTLVSGALEVSTYLSANLVASMVVVNAWLFFLEATPAGFKHCTPQ